MIQPCIYITRHQPGAYEWAVCFDQEKLGGDLPVSSIEACLDGALASLPDEDFKAEILGFTATGRVRMRAYDTPAKEWCRTTVARKSLRPGPATNN